MNKDILLAEESLKKNGFKVKKFDTIDQAKDALMEDIEVEKSIAFGGSMTLDEMALYEDFKAKGNEIYSHWVNKNTGLERAKEADIYLTSTNALTLDGKIVNMDGVGNRVSSMFYGHERVYIIAGKNKLCRDYNAAKSRIENIAGPKNAKRLDRDTPCTITGKCSDCNSAERICNVEVVIHKNTSGSNINIYLIDKELGY